jgi:hypothetical protein
MGTGYDPGFSENVSKVSFTFCAVGRTSCVSAASRRSEAAKYPVLVGRRSSVWQFHNLALLGL